MPEKMKLRGRRILWKDRPELHGHTRCHIHSKSVNAQLGPILENLDQFDPKCLFVAFELQIENIRPVRNECNRFPLTSNKWYQLNFYRLSYGFVAQIPFRMFRSPRAIVTGVSKDDVNHQTHSMLMHGRDQSTEIIDRSVFRIDLSEIVDWIRRAKCSLSIALSNGMNGKQPNEVDSHLRNSIQNQFLRLFILRGTTNRGKSSMMPSNVPFSEWLRV